MQRAALLGAHKWALIVHTQSTRLQRFGVRVHQFINALYCATIDLTRSGHECRQPRRHTMSREILRDSAQIGNARVQSVNTHSAMDVNIDETWKQSKAGQFINI